MCDEVYRLGLSKSGMATLPKPNPARCIYAMQDYIPINDGTALYELELFCYFPSRYGAYCDGVCGDYLKKRKGE